MSLSVTDPISNIVVCSIMAIIASLALAASLSNLIWNTVNAIRQHRDNRQGSVKRKDDYSTPIAMLCLVSLYFTLVIIMPAARIVVATQDNNASENPFGRISMAAQVLSLIALMSELTLVAVQWTRLVLTLTKTDNKILFFIPVSDERTREVYHKVRNAALIAVAAIWIIGSSIPGILAMFIILSPQLANVITNKDIPYIIYFGFCFTTAAASLIILSVLLVYLVVKVDSSKTSDTRKRSALILLGTTGITCTLVFVTYMLFQILSAFMDNVYVRYIGVLLGVCINLMLMMNYSLAARRYLEGRGITAAALWDKTFPCFSRKDTQRAAREKSAVQHEELTTQSPEAKKEQEQEEERKETTPVMQEQETQEVANEDV